jgi:hypothetical protein
MYSIIVNGICAEELKTRVHGDPQWSLRTTLLLILHSVSIAGTNSDSNEVRSNPVYCLLRTNGTLLQNADVNANAIEMVMLRITIW